MLMSFTDDNFAIKVLANDLFKNLKLLTNSFYIIPDKLKLFFDLGARVTRRLEDARL